jgi:hypothetical protein
MLFNTEIHPLRDSQTILRESSAATFCSSIFLTSLGARFCNGVLQKLINEVTDVRDGLQAMRDLKDRIVPELRMVFESCFRATRRRFPGELVPVMAVSSILMLRFLMPQFAVSFPEASRLGQKMLTVFVFSNPPGEDIEEEVFRKIAKFLLEISTVGMETDYCGFTEAKDCELGELLYFASKNSRLIVSAMEGKKKDNHTLVWVILELLENVLSKPEKETAHILKSMDSWAFREESC